MSIIYDAMTVNISISMWSGQKFDRAASSRVNEEAHAAHDASRVNKHLISKETMAKIVTAAGAIRSHFYLKTLPWKDNGDRLLPRKMYMDFMVEHGKLEGAFNDEVQQLIDVHYPKARAQAAFRMGDLFDPRDYPDASELQGRFQVTLDIDAVTEGKDFRVHMDAKEQERIRAGIEKSIAGRLEKAVGDVWQRLYTVVEKFHERMADKEAVFRDSLIGNIREVVELLPSLNVLESQELTDMGEQVERLLLAREPATLRKNTEEREAAATEADEILQQMMGFMRAFDGLRK